MNSRKTFGIKQEGILIGNAVDKSQLKNPIARKLVNGFDRGLIDGLNFVNPKSIHEIGCGEGRMTRMISSMYDFEIKGSDFSKLIIQENIKRKDKGVIYYNKSIYNLDKSDSADIIICCEVLEHLEEPILGLRKLKALQARNYILSVPREPLWRLLNILRLKYVKEMGNTPGHLNHWSAKKFYQFLECNGFRIIKKINPFPWIMVVCE